MNRSLGLVFCLFLSFTFFAASAQKGPRIRFEESIIDFGTISETGGVIVKEFKFKNLCNSLTSGLIVPYLKLLLITGLSAKT